VPPNSVVVGVPGQVVVRSKPIGHAPDLEHGKLPDTIGQSIAAILNRLEALERAVPLPAGAAADFPGNGREASFTPAPKIHPPEHGLWHGEDFSI
jgi:serine O-acetyltransferase